MLFPLKNIEAHVDDRFLIIGETLYEQGKVTDLAETERHLWIADVVGNEVEIQISPSKVRAVTCECAKYKNEHFCEHITAVLLKLRKELSRKSSKATKSKKHKNPAKKLTTTVILEHVSPQEIKAFIRDYARSNQAFALALKTRFAASVPMADDREKYYQLLDTTIKSARTRNDRILYKGKLKLIKIVKELLEQTDDYIASENFKDAFHILQAVIEKAVPLFVKIEGNAEKYHSQMMRAFDLMEHLIETNAAPVMRDEIRQFCMRECAKSIYRIGGFASRFFEILIDLSDDAEKMEELLQVIDNQLSSPSIFSLFKAELLVFKLNILEKQGDHAAAEKLVFDNLKEGALLLKVVRRAFENKNYERAKFLVEEGMKNDLAEKVVFNLEKILFELALIENNLEQISRYGQVVLLREKDFAVFQNIKSKIPKEEYETWRNEIIQKLDKQNYSIEKRDLIAQIYAAEGLHKELLSLIENIRSLNLLQRYDQDLMTEFKPEVARLYEEILSSFIRHHLGRKSSEKIRAALQHLNNIGARKIASNLTEKFRREYPERFTLIEELADL